MQNVRINKGDLVEKLTMNRKSHRAMFENAFEGYRQECIRLLALNLESLKAGDKIQVRFYEQAPQDHTDDYDTVLNMLNMSVEPTIELTHQEFKQYVEDDWNWREQWNTSNSKYLQK